MINKKHNFIKQILNESVEINDIYVYIDDKDDSSKLQTELFRLGFLWCDKTSIVYHPYGNDHPYDIYNMILCINLKDKDISFLSDIGEFRDYIKNDTNYNINDIILYQFKDFDKIISIIKGKPTYDSKQKPIRILEKKFYNDYKYRTVPFKIENVNDLNKIRLFLNDNKNLFVNLDININRIFAHITHQYLYKHINIIIEFMINEFGKLLFVWDVEEDFINYIDKKDYEKIFTINDLENGLIDKILKYGNSDPIPTYKPKQKPIRESNTFKFKSINIHARNNKENIQIQKKLFENGFSWGNGSTDILFDDSDDIVFLVIIYEKTILQSGNLINFKGNESYIKGAYNTDDNLYTIDDWDNKIIYIIKGINPIPTYKPKQKPIRESINNYNKVVIMIENIRESAIIQNELFKINYKWKSGDKEYLYIQPPFIIVVYLDDGIIKFADSDDSLESAFNGTYNGAYPTLFDINSLKEFITFILNGVKKLPTYKPKQKPIRE